MWKSLGKGVVLALLTAPLLAGEITSGSVLGVSRSDEGGDKATPPVYVNFQGHIRQSGSVPPDGSYNASFTIYDAASGGSVVWGPHNTTINLVSGVFNVALPIPLNVILNNTNLWIEVNIPGLGGVYNPRVKINAAAYAYNAYMSDSTQRIQDDAVDLHDIAGFNEGAATHTDLTDWDMDDNGRIDADLLDVPASGTDPGYIWNFNVTGTYQNNASFWISDFGIVGDTTTTRYAYLRRYNSGVYGISDDNTGAGVFGYGSGTDGVYGATDANFYAGVYGYGGGASNGIGVLGIGPTTLSYTWTMGGVGGSFGGDVGVYAWGYEYGVYAEDSIDALNGAAVLGWNKHESGIGGLFYADNLSSVYVPGEGAGAVADGDTFGFWGVGLEDPGGIGVLGLGNASGIGTYYIPTNGAGVVGNGNYLGVAGYGLQGGSYGVYGSSQGTSGWSIGVVGVATGGGNGVGVYGEGYYASIYGAAPIDATGFAAQFDYDVVITGGDLYMQCNDIWSIEEISYRFRYTNTCVGDKGDRTLPPDVITLDEAEDVPLGYTYALLEEIYYSGKDRVSGGKVEIRLPEALTKIADPSTYVVVVTPVGAPSNVWVSDITEEGFIIHADSDVEVHWSIRALVKDYATLEERQQALAQLKAEMEAKLASRLPSLAPRVNKEATEGVLVKTSSEPLEHKIKRTEAESGKVNPGEVR